MYAELNGAGVRTNDVKNAEESKRFWCDIWDIAKRE